MRSETSLTPHPRLYIGADAYERAKMEQEWGPLRGIAEDVVAAGERHVRTPPLDWTPDKHNGHLLRARAMQSRVVTLLVRYAQTGRQRFRRAVMRCIAQMGEWEYWSWIAWRAGEKDADAIFDLSYGENSATLSIAYDWLHGELSEEERALFLQVADRPFRSGLRRAKADEAWWFGKPDSNWNTVCAGGLGMLALAMYEDAPQAHELLPRAEESVEPFMRALDDSDGAWPEGIGYWNYGMRYAFMYLLSHERAMARPHPLMGLRGVRQTMSFPLDFCPHGQPCSFGDVNSWSPLPFHYAAAERLGRLDVMAQIDERLSTQGIPAGTWPDAAEWLLLHPGRPAGAGSAPSTGRVIKLYHGMDWGILADRLPRPTLYAAVRGGTTEVPHGHRDLLSFHCVVGGERLVTDLKPTEYLDTTFSPRRDEMLEMTPAAKNTILINGVGVTVGSALDSTEKVTFPGADGLRLVATGAMGTMRDGPAVAFCGRLVLMLEVGAFLIVDRIELPHAGRMESRMHTFAQVRAMKRGAVLRGDKQQLRVVYACSVPAVLRTAVPALTTPTMPEAHALRWCTVDRVHTDVVMATLLTPGPGAASVALCPVDRGISVLAGGKQWETALRLTPKLRPSRAGR